MKYKYFVMPSGVSRLQSRGKSYKKDGERNLSQVTQLKETMTMSCPVLGPLIMISRLRKCEQMGYLYTEHSYFLPTEGW